MFFFQGTCSPIGLVRQPTEEHLQHHHPLRNYQLLVSLHRRKPCRPEQGNSGVLDNRRSIVPSWASNNFSPPALLTFYVFRLVFLRFFCFISFIFFYFFRQALAAGFSLEGFLSGFPSFFAPNRIEKLFDISRREGVYSFLFILQIRFYGQYLFLFL